MEDGVQIGNLTIPIAKGEKGDTGQAGTIVSISVTMLSTTATPYANNTGTPTNAVIELGIPVGIGISSAEINSDGELELTLSNGTELNCGVVVGTSITNVDIDEDFDFVVTLSNGEEIVAGNIETELTGVIEDALADYYDKDTSDGKYALITETGNKIDLSINNTTYVMTLTLKDKNNNTLSTATVDLPLESVVVSGAYDSANKKIVLTLQGGSTIEFSVADLVAGLQSEITSSNKLSADLVDDTSTTHKFVSASDKTAWNAKVDNTDYATSGTGGVIKVSTFRGTEMSSGIIQAVVKTYEQYQSTSSTSTNAFISKGTLENVITGKDLTTKSYVDGLVGDIESALETLDEGSGV